MSVINFSNSFQISSLYGASSEQTAELNPMPSQDREELHQILNRYTSYPARVHENILKNPEHSGQLIYKIISSAINKATPQQESDLRFLLLNGANCNYIFDYDHKGNISSFQEAISKFSVEILELFIENGASINIEDQHLQRDPLRSAVCSGKIEKVRFLVEHGVNMNLHMGDTKYYGYSPLGSVLSLHAHRFHSCSKYEMLKLLLESGLNVYSGPFSQCVWQTLERECFADLSVIDLLLKHGLSVNSKDKNGKSTLEKAVSIGDTQLIELLRKYGA